MSNYIKTNWMPTELKILSSNLADDIELKTLERMLPKRSSHAIIAKAKDDFNYGTKKENGAIKFYFDVKRRVGKNTLNVRATGEVITSDNFKSSEVLKKKSEESIADIAEESRVTTNNTGLATSERTNENLSDVILSKVALTKDLTAYDVNIKVIDILKSNNIEATPKLIYQLSEYTLTRGIS